MFKTPLILVGLMLILIAIPMAFMGYKLAALGGTPFYLVCSLGLILSGGLFIFGMIQALYIFLIVFCFTIFWAISEAGFAFWPQVPRILSPIIIAIPVTATANLFPRIASRQRLRMLSLYTMLFLFCSTAVFIIAMMYPHGNVEQAGGAWTSPALVNSTTTWDHFGGSAAGTRYVGATQLTPENVRFLKQEWIYHTGRLPIADQTEEATPLQIGDTLYLCTSTNMIIALDAESGKERWKFDPKTGEQTFARCRGLAYYAIPALHSSDTKQEKQDFLCVRRIIEATVDARLVEVDANTGRPCLDFGGKGSVDLKVGMGNIPYGYWYQTSAPTVARGLIIVGGYHLDNRGVSEPSGVVRAFDVINGSLKWAWDLGNPLVTALPPSGKTYTLGTPNVWAPPSADETLGLVYLPTGNSTPDFWGGYRSPAEDRYSSSIVALNLATGKVRWSFQTVHHDVWDYDVASQPILYDLPTDGGHTQPVLIQVTKRGQIFMLDRRTGTPVARVEERRVPQAPAPGDRNAPTQPYSAGLPSIGANRFKENEMWGATLLDQLWCRLAFKQTRYDGEFTAPNLDQSLQFPGQTGGMNWGSASIDERHAYLYVNDIRIFFKLQLIPRQDADKILGTSEFKADPHSLFAPQAGTPFGAFRAMFVSPLGFPCQNPPYGTLTAIDLRARRIVWQRPAGTLRDTGPLGIKGLDFPIGMPTLGGSIATAGGLVFFAGTRDASLRAIDSRGGQELWRQRLPAVSTATPISYISPKSGRQFVALVVGGAVGKTRGDYVIAYALPK